MEIISEGLSARCPTAADGSRFGPTWVVRGDCSETLTDSKRPERVREAEIDSKDKPRGQRWADRCVAPTRVCMWAQRKPRREAVSITVVVLSARNPEAVGEEEAAWSPGRID